MSGYENARSPASPGGESQSRVARMLDGGEFVLAEVLSLCGLLWLVLMMIHAGPLWRDELCSVNLAESASLKIFWDHLHHDSCPILWPATLRAWLWLGLSGDSQIRVLGFLIGVCFLASPWLIAHWVGRRVPILSVSLLSFSPAVLFTVGSVRAYGMGSLMLVCAVGLTWRAVERSSTARLAWLMVASVLAAHSLYTAAPFLLVILGAGILVLLHRRDWRRAAWIMVIGCLTMGSMLMYLSVIARAGESFGLHQIPIDLPWLALSAKRAVATAGAVHVWAWGVLILLGIVSMAGYWMKRLPKPAREGDMRLFFLVIMLATPAAYAVTLLRLKVPTQFWYYVPLMAVVSVAMDGLMGGRPCSPWIRVCRLAIAVLLPISAFPAVWQEVHTRRTNLDIAAQQLVLHAGPEDLIIVDPFYLGTSFDRYYAGKTRWTTLPSVEDTRSGGHDAVRKAMMEKEPLRQLLSSATDTFRHGNRVWVVGQFMLIEPQKLPPAPPPPPNGPLGWNHGPYSHYWSLQLGAFLLSHSRQICRFSTDPGKPVNPHEDVALVVFLAPPQSQGEQDRRP